MNTTELFNNLDKLVQRISWRTLHWDVFYYETTTDVNKNPGFRIVEHDLA